MKFFSLIAALIILLACTSVNAQSVVVNKYFNSGSTVRLLGPKPSPSDAIRKAQLAMISGKKYSAPFYWAPFVLVGEWK